jgi:hypothetical protein
MPVVINEFEVVSEPLPKKPGGEQGSSRQSEAQGAQAPTPHDIVCIVRYHKERLVRVRAC